MVMTRSTSLATLALTDVAKRRLADVAEASTNASGLASSSSDPPTPIKSARPPSSGIPERKAYRKPKRHDSSLTVLETYPSTAKAGVVDVDGESSCDEKSTKPRCGGKRKEAIEEEDEADARFKYKRRRGTGDEAEETAFARLGVGFAEDYFTSPCGGKIVPAAVAMALRHPDGVAGKSGNRHGKAVETVTDENLTKYRKWLDLIQDGFSLLFQGCGSKRHLVEEFADKALLPWGAAVVRMDAFSARFSMADCLRAIFEQVQLGVVTSLRGGGRASVEALVEAISVSRRRAVDNDSFDTLRPLVLVVHNMEKLPLPHQASLASLVANAPRAHLVASVDRVWAPLEWSPRVVSDFNFAHVEAHTYEDYTFEAAARFGGGLPAWADPHNDRRKGKKASLSLVLRSLTNNHRELVQAIAERQIELGGRTGISRSALLAIATDRIIATHASKLRSLLNELKDHEVVVERAGPDGSVLYQLPCDDETMRRLAENIPLDASDDEESGDD